MVYARWMPLIKVSEGVTDINITLKILKQFFCGEIMAKQQILKRNKLILTKSDCNTEKILNHLKTHIGKAFTQKQLADALGISQATISRRIKDDIGVGNIIDFYNVSYRIEKVAEGYMLVKDTIKNNQIVADKTLSMDEEKAIERRETRVFELAEKNVCESNCADIMPATVILYKLKKSRIVEVENALLSTFGAEMFYGIFKTEEGLYIVLKKQNNNKTSDNIDENAKKILDFYNEIVYIMEMNKKASKAKQKILSSK